MMSLWVVLLLQLLLVSLASTSHYFGASVTFRYKGKNPDGSIRVDVQKRATFDGCLQQYSYCVGPNCGQMRKVKNEIIDRSSNAPEYNNIWCETEESSVWALTEDKPFQMRAASCCWIPTRNFAYSWRWTSFIDLGTRSDTGKPNKPPVIAILPFLRVPQNCPRTYKLISFDPDGDRVRCRYGKKEYTECDSCSPPSGFHLDQDSCTLQYQHSYADPRVFAFEMVVEDFSRKHMDLVYKDGTQSHRHPMTSRRRKRASFTPFPQTSPTTFQHTQGPTTPLPPVFSPHSTRRVLRATQSTSTQQQAGNTQKPPSWWWTTFSPYQSTTTSSPTTTQPLSATQAGSSLYVHTTQVIPGWWWPTTARPLTRTAGFHLPRTTRWLGWPRASTINPYQTTPGPDKFFDPFSKLPLQFSVLVDPPVESCEDGVFIPRFVYPTPRDGARILAELDKLVEIRIQAETIFSWIHDIIISGPITITKRKTTHNEFILGLRPTEDELGEHLPVCFAVEAVSWPSTGINYTTLHNFSHHYHGTPSSQSGIYQSEMRCILLQVVQSKVNVNVICSESSMQVELKKSSLVGFNEDGLRLNDPTNTVCSLKTNTNSTHVIGVIPLNACGTQIEEDEDNLFFKNEITTVSDNQNLITRKNLLEIQFYCQYPKRGNVTLSFIGHRDKTIVWERGFGTFTYEFEFYPNDNFRTMIDPNSYPLEYDIGTRIYMQIEASTSVNNTQIFVESCRAAPYDNPNYSPAYKIIENGCNVDPTLMIYNSGHERLFQFSMEAFRFIGMYEQVYISCSVLVCEAGNPNTRCSLGCVNATLPNMHNSHHRHRREAVIQSQRHFVSQGPLRLKRSSEGGSVGGLSLNLSLVVVSGCVIAALGAICGLVVYKVKMSSIQYQRLPNREI